MGGLEFLSWIMRNRPLPVVMVSRLTTAGAEMTIKALELGAVDWVAKPTPEDPHTFRDLSAKVQRAAQCQLPRQHGRQHASQHRRLASSTRETYQPNGRVVAIGSSTGGVEALISLLSEFPENCPATLTAQDTPAPYTRSFAERLDRLCRPRVSEAIDGEPVLPGRVYLAPGGGAHLEVDRDNGLLCRLRQEAPVNGQRPSVDVLFTSVAKFVGRRAIGVILTGMGRDGACGLLAMRQSGAVTFGQDAETSIVYGMPKAAFELGAVSKQLPLQRIAREILLHSSPIP